MSVLLNTFAAAAMAGSVAVTAGGADVALANTRRVLGFTHEASRPASCESLPVAWRIGQGRDVITIEAIPFASPCAGPRLKTPVVHGGRAQAPAVTSARA